MISDDADCQAAKPADVLGSVVFANPTIVFSECHVHDPMQWILDAPVLANRIGKG